MASFLSFTKFEGLGNDFLVVAVTDEGLVDGARAASLCDRHRGVGADGVLLVLPPTSPRAVARMKVINADGSVPEMCGNGLRCVALHLWGALGRATFDVETDAGVRSCSVDPEDAAALRGDAVLVTVGMGRVTTGGTRRVDLGNEVVDVAIADAGNPHAVLFGPIDPERWARIAPGIATHRVFPNGTNVGLAEARGDGLDLVVWERGVGLTMACGTGACAAVAVAADRGLVPVGRPVDVRLPGGTLAITRDRATGETLLRGPARRVFSGSVG